MKLTLKIFVCFILLTGIYPVNADHKSTLYFDNISIQDGLSQVSVLSMMQDNLGFMWFGTMDGLNMYDGYTFRIYRHNPNDSASISNNRITCMTRDSSNYLWFGTDYGLNRFSRKSQRFKVFISNQTDSGSLSDNYITDLCIDPDGGLWIGGNAGIDQYNSQSETFTNFNPFEPERGEDTRVTVLAPASAKKIWVGTNVGLFQFNRGQKRYVALPENLNQILGQSYITAICQDDVNTWWFGTNAGLYRYDFITNQLAAYKKNQKMGLRDDHINSICKTRDGKVWIGTSKGIHIFNNSGNTFSSYVHDTDKINSLSGNDIIDIYEARSGIVWISIEASGVDKFNLSKQGFRSFLWQVETGSIKENLVYAFCEDQRNNYWVGTNNGIILFDQNFKQIKTYHVDSPGKEKISDNRVRTIVESRDGAIWIGSYGGVNQLDPKNRLVRNFRDDANSALGLGQSQVITILEDHDGELWFGTNSGGITRWVSRAESLTKMRHIPGNDNSLSSDLIRVIIQDREEIIWIGTYGGGLSTYDKRTGRFTHFRHRSGDSASISSNYIYSIYEDPAGFIWIGTYGAGLNCYDRKANRFYSYTTKNGLPNDVVYGILEGTKEDLWLSTNKGLAHLSFADGNNEKHNLDIRNYDMMDGLQNDEFNFGAYMKSRNGLLFFGGVRGFNVFHPDSIKVNKAVPNVVLTDFKTFNESVSVGEANSPLDSAISETESIELSYEFNVISFEFAALHFINPQKNQYAYMLDGQDKEWIYTNAGQRFAHYSNLKGGDYVFRVRASNSDGVWNQDGVNLKLKIIPPLWNKGWFRIGISVFLLALVLMIYRVLTQSIRRRNRILKMNNERLNLEIREKETAQKALKESEDKYRTILENSPIGIFHFNLDGMITRYNQIFLKTFNFPEDEKTEINLFTSFPMVELSEAAANCLENGFGLTETIVPSTDHKNKSIRVQLSAIYEHGQINGGVGILEDTSERNRAQMLQEIVYRIARGISDTKSTSEFYELIRIELSKTLDTKNFFIGFYEKEGDTIYLPFMKDEKDRFERLPAYGTISDLVIKKKQSMLLNSKAMEQLENEGAIQSVGSPCMCWMGVPLIVEDEVIGIIVVQSYESDEVFTESDQVLLEFVASQVAFSIKEKQAQEEIRKLSLIIEQSRSSVVIATAEGVIEYVNPVLLQELDLPQPKAYKLNLRTIFKRAVSNENYEDMIQHVLDGKEWKQEISLESGHARKWHYIVCSPVIDDLSKTTHIVMVKEDISNTKMLQEQLNQAQKMESIGTLAGGIAHDFNNLLTVINGHAEIALLRIGEKSKAHKDIISILHAGKRAENLTRQLLAFSRRQIFQAKILDLNHLISNMKKMVARLIGEDIQIELKLNPKIPPVKADPGQIEQIIMNLVINARDALRAVEAVKPDKKITVETKHDHLESNQFNHETQAGEYVLLSVSDNGVGMNTEILNKIFEPFFTTKGIGKGTGLGLATVYGIVKQNHAYIKADSELNKGSVFTVFWPAVNNAEVSLTKTEKSSEIPKGHETILLVEDEDQVRQFAKEGLKSSGYTVNEAVNGLDAMNLIDQKNADIQLVITDLIMPEMSGNELANHVKMKYPDIKIIITSGYADDHEIYKGYMDAEIDFLQKPYSLRDLLNRVRKVLDQKKTPPE